MKDKRNVNNYLLNIILFMIAIAIGVTFALFQGQRENSKRLELKMGSATIDSLTFSTSGDLSFQATIENMGKGKTSIHGSVEARAQLISESNNEYNYSVYLNITENNFKYTTSDEKPELILIITDPNGDEITDGINLNYHNKRLDDANDISGYDVTEAYGLIPITINKSISLPNLEKNNVEQNWHFDLYFINFADANQSENSGNAFDANVVIKNETSNP